MADRGIGVVVHTRPGIRIPIGHSIGLWPVECHWSGRQRRLVAEDVGDRQRRRKTWQQNVDRYALPSGAKVRVVVAGRATGSPMR